jgi:two-component system, OmpR family, osmolarity sensor histidine kinase EnvZ
MSSGLAVKSKVSGLAAKPAHLLPGAVRPPRVVPRSLFSRTLLIVIMPLLILQVVLTYVFYERHWDRVTRTLAFGLAGEVGLLVELLEAAPTPEARAQVLDLARKHFQFAVSLEPEGNLGVAEHSGGLLPPARLDQKLQERFNEALDHPFVIDTRWVDAPNEPDRIAVSVQLDHGILRVLPPRKRVDSDTTRVFIGWMVGLSLLLLTLAVYFMTRQVRPILRLARAMDKFGKGRDLGDFRIAGPTEIRRAGAAFNMMRKRLLRHISQRTEMLAAVSHDLRTPLTRMKLELEMLGEARVAPGQLDDLRADVEEMARVVDGYLDFARGEGQEGIVRARRRPGSRSSSRSRSPCLCDRSRCAAASLIWSRTPPATARSSASARRPRTTRSGSPSTTTVPGLPRTSGKPFSGPSTGSMPRGDPRPAASAWA